MAAVESSIAPSSEHPAQYDFHLTAEDLYAAECLLHLSNEAWKQSIADGLGGADSDTTIITISEADSLSVGASEPMAMAGTGARKRRVARGTGRNSAGRSRTSSLKKGRAGTTLVLVPTPGRGKGTKR
jgi:hypothetical protein